MQPKIRLWILLVCALIMFSSAACLAKTVYVKTTGLDTNDGLSWDTAKKTVAAGITTAVSGDEVHVALGVYVENLTMRDGVALYGGYSPFYGTRDIKAYESTLDGNNAGYVITASSCPSTATRVDGFVIRNGTRGISCSASALTIANCTVRSCGSSSGLDCGILCGTNASTGPAIVADNTITSNGGGIIVSGCVGYLCAPIIRNNIIKSNRSSGGAGIACRQYATPQILNNMITENLADGYGGAIATSTYSNPVIANNLIKANASNATGGGVGGVYCNSNATLINNTIVGNTSNGTAGDGVHIASSVTGTVVKNNLIAFNATGVYGQSRGTFRNNCVFGNVSGDYSGTDPTGTNGNISSDPKVVAWQYGDYHIQPDSPCVDAGDSSAVQDGWTDLDSTIRKQDGNGDGSAVVDIGAYESNGTMIPFSPTIIRVKAGRDDSQDGSSWSKAMGTIQTAIDAVWARGGGEVWVAKAAWVASLNLRAYVHVYGGFAGTEVAQSDRDWRRNITNISGATSGNGVHTHTIDGFAMAGGVSCEYWGSPVISNNTMRGITSNCSSPIILNNIITGGSYSGISCTSCSPLIAGNLIVANSNSTNGGGISCRQGSNALVVSNTIVNNIAPTGGAIYISGSSPTLVNNVIVFNSSGIYKASGTGGPTLQSNCVYGNTSYAYSGVSAGPTDISFDPLFVNRTGGDYHLTAGSPCINQGLSTVLGLPTYDFDGEGRVFDGTVDIGADEYWSSLLSANETKKAPEGAVIKLSASTVSGKFADFFYIEADDRSGGIRVDKTGFSADEDSKVIITGKVKTNDGGERFIAADSVAPDSGTLDIKPILLSMRDLGGGEIGLQDGASSKMLVGPAGQAQYVWNEAIGVNNIGLLVSVIGNVTFTGIGFFYLDDGSKMDDGSGNYGVKVMAAGFTFSSSGFVKVTGIVSCEKNGDKLVRLLRVRKQEDIVPL